MAKHPVILLLNSVMLFCGPASLRDAIFRNKHAFGTSGPAAPTKKLHGPGFTASTERSEANRSPYAMSVAVGTTYALMIAVLLWNSFAGPSGIPANVPIYGISTKGGSSGNRDRDLATIAEKEDTSNSLIESTRTRVVVSWLATRDVFVFGSFAPPPLYTGPPADSSAFSVTAISAEDAVAKLRGVAEKESARPICA